MVWPVGRDFGGVCLPLPFASACGACRAACSCCCCQPLAWPLAMMSPRGGAQSSALGRPFLVGLRKVAQRPRENNSGSRISASRPASGRRRRMRTTPAAMSWAAHASGLTGLRLRAKIALGRCQVLAGRGAEAIQRAPLGLASALVQIRCEVLGGTVRLRALHETANSLAPPRSCGGGASLRTWRLGYAPQNTKREPERMRSRGFQ